jgi:hypothetical protein
MPAPETHAAQTECESRATACGESRRIRWKRVESRRRECESHTLQCVRRPAVCEEEGAGLDRNGRAGMGGRGGNVTRRALLQRILSAVRHAPDPHTPRHIKSSQVEPSQSQVTCSAFSPPYEMPQIPTRLGSARAVAGSGGEAVQRPPSTKPAVRTSAYSAAPEDMQWAQRRKRAP